MRRIGWTLVCVLGCAVTERDDDAGERRMLSDFDPVRWEVLDREQLEASGMIAELDGEQVPLEAIVDGEWVVRERAPLPDGPAASDDLTNPIGDGAAGPCPYTIIDTYDVPVSTQTWVCYPGSGGSLGYCVMGPIVIVQHHVVCQNSCGHCGTFNCTDTTTNTSTSRPADQYLTSDTWIACWP